MIAEQLKTFEGNLATKPYCTDNKDHGLLIRPKASAIKKKYIQHNKPTSVKFLVFDIDYPGVAEHIGDNHLPPPNFIAYNKKTGRSHVYYILETEVYTVENARRSPIKFLSAIQYQLCVVLLADQGYTGFVCKNPFSEEWEVQFFRQQTWTLGEFQEWITLPAKIPPKAKRQGLGRNCDLFEGTRKVGYSLVDSFRAIGDREGLFDAVLEYARKYNQKSFPVPLNDSEVRATAKSIARWTWRKYTGKKVIDAAFIAKQSAQGKKSGETRLQKTMDSRAMANMFSMIGLKQTKIASILNCGQKTVSRWLIE